MLEALEIQVAIAERSNTFNSVRVYGQYALVAKAGNPVDASGGDEGGVSYKFGMYPTQPFQLLLTGLMLLASIRLPPPRAIQGLMMRC